MPLWQNNALRVVSAAGAEGAGEGEHPDIIRTGAAQDAGAFLGGGTGGQHIVVSYKAEPDANALVVALRPKGSDAPATTKAFELTKSTGQIEIPAGDADYDVWTSVAVPDRGASEGVNAG